MTSDTRENPIATPRIDECGPESISGAYLRQFWMPVAMLDEVAPGRARMIMALGETFTYYRGESGTPHLVAPRCAHRMVQLSVGTIEGECIRCYYHAWMYDETGQCVEQPAEEESFKRKVRIAGYPTEVMHGVVFGYFGPGDPPAFPRIAALDRPGGVFSDSYTRQSNFFNAIENSLDWVHVNFVHGRSGFTEFGRTHGVPVMSGEETDYGLLGEARHPDGTLTTAHILMPATALMKVPADVDGSNWVDHAVWRVPLDDNSYRSFIISRIDMVGEEFEHFMDKRKREREHLATLQPAAEIIAAVLRGDMYVDEIDSKRPDIVNIQDAVLMTTQAPINSRVGEQLGRSDIAGIKVRHIWERELRAFAAGQPTKKWDWSSPSISAQVAGYEIAAT